MEQQKIRIKLKAFDHKLVDKSTKENENKKTPSISFSLSILSIGLLTLLRRN